MKAENLRALTDAELNKKLNDLKTELFNLRFSNATGSLTNPLSLNVCKKEIAKIKTVLRERELGISNISKAKVVPNTAKKEAVKKAEVVTKEEATKKAEVSTKKETVKKTASKPAEKKTATASTTVKKTAAKKA